MGPTDDIPAAEAAAANPEATMGRPPIHDSPMSPAERQRRRRERLREAPWEDPRALAWSLVEALRALKADPARPVDGATCAALVEKAVAALAPAGGGEAGAAREALLRLLDPAEPLPVRGHGHRHGFGARHGHHHHHHRRRHRHGHGHD